MNLLDIIGEYLQRIGSGSYEPWTIASELLIIGTVVYSTLRFLQGTRGARLMQGIGLVVLIAFVVIKVLAQELNWERIEFLFQYFVGGVFLLVLVVFQPELRRAFMRIGERSWFFTFVKRDSNIIEPVAVAAAGLSRKRIGALIAIERVTGLSAIIDTGVPIDGELTPELLHTIFWPGSALHDMGVVVRNGRIAAAGCQFPLAESDDLDRSLGSRHRAALGLSLEADVVVVVVSEESGAISLAYQGHLHRDLDDEALRRLMARTIAGETLAQTTLEPTPETENCAA